MMGAPSLPTPQAAMPAGFAAFLANIGQLPDGGGEGAGFDQLLAAAPLTAAPIAHAAAPVGTDPALPVDVAIAPAESPPTTIAVATPAALAAPEAPGKAPTEKPKPAETDAATLAANLLVVLNGSVRGHGPVPGKPVAVDPESEADTEAATPGETPTAEAAATAKWAENIVPAIPAAAKPAKPAATTLNAAPSAARTDAPPTSPVTPRAQTAAAPSPIPVGADASAARSVDAPPSMTILFTQPVAHGAAALAEASAPALIAERVLDTDSDGAWIDQLARDIAATKSDSGDVSFRLMPRHLGRLDVAMQMGDEGLSLTMDTHHEATATIVTAAQGRLVDELRQQGVRVAGAEVTCTPGETGRQSPGQGQGRAGTPDTTHLIETAAERAETRAAADSDERAADRRGRFA